MYGVVEEKIRDPYQRKLALSRYHARIIEQEFFYFDYPQNQVQRERAFELRYEVFCQECNIIPEELFSDNREKDTYDDLALTRMFVVLNPEKENAVAGVVRAIRDPQNSRYNPCMAFNNFSEPIKHLPIERYMCLDSFREEKRNIEQVASLAVGCQRGKKIPFGLFKAIYLDAIDHHIDDIFIIANPSAVFLFEAIGFEKLFEGCYEGGGYQQGAQSPLEKRVPILGMHLDMKKINESFLHYFRKPSRYFLFRKDCN